MRSFFFVKVGGLQVATYAIKIAPNAIIAALRAFASSAWVIMISSALDFHIAGDLFQ